MAENANIIQIAEFGRIATRARQSKPPRDLVPSEFEALRALGRFVIITPELFEVFSGYAYSEAARGLRFLFQRGLADRGYYFEPRTDIERTMSAPRIPKGLAYKLTPKGKKKGVDLGVIDHEVPIIGRRWNGSAPNDMRHRLLSIEFMIRMALDVSKQERLHVGRTIYDFLREDKKSATKEKLPNGQEIEPDIIFDMGSFFVSAANKFFVEVENTKLKPCSQEPKERTITTKLAKYSKYLAMPGRKHKGSGGDALMYVQNQGVDHLKEAISNIDWDAVGDVKDAVRMTTFDDVREHGILNGVWLDWQGRAVGVG